MGDRELLELAAKAAGFTGRWTADWYKMSNGMTRWDPLRDDGDALRLAVKLSLSLTIGDIRHPLSASEASTEDGESAIERHDGDPCAATRRAIVRAAAELGRNIAKGNGGGT